MNYGVLLLVDRNICNTTARAAELDKDPQTSEKVQNVSSGFLETFIFQ